MTQGVKFGQNGKVLAARSKSDRAGVRTITRPRITILDVDLAKGE